MNKLVVVCIAAILASFAEADKAVSGPLTGIHHGNFVETPRGLRPLDLEGFSEDLDEDGFVDPIVPVKPVAVAPAPLHVPAPVHHHVAAPVHHHVPAVHHAIPPVGPVAPVHHAVHHALPAFHHHAAAPVAHVHHGLHHPIAPVAAPFAAQVTPYPLPIAHQFNVPFVNGFSGINGFNGLGFSHHGIGY